MTAKKTTIKEFIEWTNMRWNNAPDTQKPRILLVGDSIVVGHGDQLFELIKDNACLDYLATAKCVSDTDYMTELDYMLSRNNYRIILFNNGLHGWDVDDKIYAENLREVLTCLKTKTQFLVWRNSTPQRIVGNLEEFDVENNPRVIKRNAEAEKIARALGIPTLDLYTPMAKNPGCFNADGVHYNDDGKKFQAEAIAAFFMPLLI
ncbi:MAG: SGNH/GDSL hydrolase family protein [Phycisphaerae bacterium]